MTSDLKYLVGDAETTGISVHDDRIVQFFIGIADEAGNLVDRHEWVINPGVPVPQEAADVHGFDDAYLAEHGRDPVEALMEIRDVYLKHRDLTWVFYNANFDLSILDAEFKRHGISENFGTWARDNAVLIDPLVIDRAKDKYRKGKRTLEAVAGHYGVPFDPDAAHDALYDTKVTAKVAVKILEKYGWPTNQEQAACYREWAEGLETHLRKTDPDARVDREWPLRLKEEK